MVSVFFFFFSTTENAAWNTLEHKCFLLHELGSPGEISGTGAAGSKGFEVFSQCISGWNNPQN